MSRWEEPEGSSLVLGTGPPPHAGVLGPELREDRGSLVRGLALCVSPSGCPLVFFHVILDEIRNLVGKWCFPSSLNLSGKNLGTQGGGPGAPSLIYSPLGRSTAGRAPARLPQGRAASWGGAFTCAACLWGGSVGIELVFALPARV